MIRRTRAWISMSVCIAAVVLALVAIVVGRGVNPASILPRLATSSASSTLYVDFVSVVNLPLGARVLSRGAQIGTLEAIDLVPDAARLTLAVDAGVTLPKGTKAELRQSTLLGDIYVALTPPVPATRGTLADGDLIGLADTDPGPQIEDIITNLADFMAGGSMLRLQDALRQVNKSVDVPGSDLRGASRVTAQDISDLAADTANLDAIITSLHRASTEIASDPAALGYSMGEQGKVGLRAVFGSINEGFKLVAGSSKLAFGLTWMVPRLAQLNPFLDELVPLLRTYSRSSMQFNGNAGKLVDLTTDKLIPFSRNGTVSIDKITAGPDDAVVTTSVTAVLRMIGAVR